MAAGDENLSQIIQFTASHHIVLAIEGEMQTPGANDCGDGVESYRPAGTIASLASRIKSLSGKIDIIAMDEPLWFGHVARSFWRPSASVCHASIDEVAKNTAKTIAEVRRIFPGVVVGDIEPLPNLYGKAPVPRDYLAELRRWIDAFRQQNGRPLAFIHFDIGWQRTILPQNNALEQRAWPGQLRSAVAIARQNHLRFGIIYNGDPTDASNIVWTTHAIQRYHIVEQTLKIYPDDVIFQTWMKYPNAVVPESTPGTLTNLLYSYINEHDEPH